MKMKLILLLLFYFWFQPGFAQFEKLVQSAENCMNESPDSSLLILKNNLGKIKRLGDTILMIKAFNCYGVSSAMIGDNKTALESFKYNEKLLLNSKKYSQLSDVYGNIANVYAITSEFPKAIKYNLKALKLQEKLKDSSGISTTYNNIGNIYYIMNDLPSAANNYRLSLTFMDTLKEPELYARSMANLAGLYSDMKIIDSSELFSNKALNLFKKLKDYQSIAMMYNNISARLRDEGNLEEAIKMQLESVAMKKMTGDKGSLSNSYIMLGDLYSRKNKWSESINSCLLALLLAKETQTQSNERDACSCLYLSYAARGDFKNAYYYLQNFYTIRDTIINSDKIKEITEQKMNFEFERKQMKDSILAKEKEIKRDFEQKSKDIKKEEELKQQKIFTFSGIAGILLMLVIAYLLFKSIKRKKQDNQLILQQKRDVEIQKHLVEEKNKEITDSINYAKRLQQAILAPESEIKKYLPQSFLLYQPKDIVAGDFYFFEVTDSHIFYAAADCTGHGVPGAMVSIVCSNALTRCVKEFEIIEPGKILDKTRDLILETFQKSGEDVKDGMDISLIAINRKTNEILWAGANNPLWYFQNSEIKEIVANKQPIGKTDNPKPFTNHILPRSVSTIFLFTDGFADQFGGTKGKKFKYSNLQKLLLENSNETLQTINEKLSSKFSEWKGDLEQVDDVCIIGIRV